MALERASAAGIQDPSGLAAARRRATRPATPTPTPAPPPGDHFVGSKAEVMTRTCTSRPGAEPVCVEDVVPLVKDPKVQLGLKALGPGQNIGLAGAAIAESDAQGAVSQAAIGFGRLAEVHAPGASLVVMGGRLLTLESTGKVIKESLTKGSPRDQALAGAVIVDVTNSLAENALAVAGLASNTAASASKSFKAVSTRISAGLSVVGTAISAWDFKHRFDNAVKARNLALANPHQPPAVKEKLAKQAQDRAVDATWSGAALTLSASTTGVMIKAARQPANAKALTRAGIAGGLLAAGATLMSDTNLRHKIVNKVKSWLPGQE